MRELTTHELRAVSGGKASNSNSVKAEVAVLLVDYAMQTVPQIVESIQSNINNYNKEHPLEITQQSFNEVVEVVKQAVQNENTDLEKAQD